MFQTTARLLGIEASSGSLPLGLRGLSYKEPYAVYDAEYEPLSEKG